MRSMGNRCRLRTAICHRNNSAHNPPTFRLPRDLEERRGEIIRLALTVAGQEFEDYRFEFEEWPDIKKGTPCGQVPVLEVDGKQMNESIAIARYIAKIYDLGGKDAYEQYLIDRVLGAVDDLYCKARQPWFAEQDQSKKIELERELYSEHLPRFLGMFKKYLKDSGGDGKFFVGDSVTLADLAVHDILTTFLQRNERLLEAYPELISNRIATEALPKLAAYLAKRPKCDL
ncbi:hypothetical protein FSP39_008045 [Pinctada imbricata]|uniref:glutathione transferase n=1 Tax=Pinctada imbricata TaxID=66713 RepID=A0AA88YQC9_PINIB|nr:hypothetical protein FSP39_008045 [Pinctada imbricata]